MSETRGKWAWYLGGVLILGLAILGVSCDSGILPRKQPAAPTPTIVPPLIPHSLEGRADCRLCHEAGIGGAPQFPSDHSQRPSDVCLACHEPALVKERESAVATTPAPPLETKATAISAGELYGNRCAACHGVNRQGISGFAPALTAENLAALSDTEIRDMISDGRAGTAMPAFKGTLSPEEIDALLQLIKHTSP